MSVPRLARRKPDFWDDAQLQEAYVHLTSRQCSTFTLAKSMGISPATAFRLVKALRSRGLQIVSMKEGSRWFYALKGNDDPAFKDDPLVKARGFIRGVRIPRGKSFNQAIDDAVYGNP